MEAHKTADRKSTTMIVDAIDALDAVHTNLDGIRELIFSAALGDSSEIRDNALFTLARLLEMEASTVKEARNQLGAALEELR